MDDYHAFNSTKGGSGGGSNGGSNGGINGPGCVVIIIVVLLLLFFIFDGASWDAIDTLLGFGFLAFLFVRSL